MRVRIDDLIKTAADSTQVCFSLLISTCLSPFMQLPKKASGICITCRHAFGKQNRAFPAPDDSCQADTCPMSNTMVSLNMGRKRRYWSTFNIGVTHIKIAKLNLTKLSITQE